MRWFQLETNIDTYVNIRRSIQRGKIPPAPDAAVYFRVQDDVALVIFNDASSGLVTPLPSVPRIVECEAPGSEDATDVLKLFSPSCSTWVGERRDSPKRKHR